MDISHFQTYSHATPPDGKARDLPVLVREVRAWRDRDLTERPGVSVDSTERRRPKPPRCSHQRYPRASTFYTKPLARCVVHLPRRKKVPKYWSSPSALDRGVTPGSSCEWLTRIEGTVHLSENRVSRLLVNLSRRHILTPRPSGQKGAEGVGMGAHSDTSEPPSPRKNSKCPSQVES